MDGTDTPQKAARDEYHVQIWNAINDLQRAIDSIGFLRDRIEQEDAPKTAEAAVDAPAPSLNGFLQGAAGNIAEEADRLRRLRDEIQVLLF